ncbi:Proteinase inhibitor I12, Bowman-Birk [Sesbania bispinosa]|nr:Proteinase inhibitor I12, Bowman-Birk [Sesbania bispinosa]
MEFNKKTLVKVALLLFLMDFTTATVDAARFDPRSFINQVLSNGGGDDGSSYSVKSTTTACCDNCYCTFSIPPQCHCADVGETCHSACKVCACTRSIPPKCRCLDTTTFCYDKCTSSQAIAQ